MKSDTSVAKGRRCGIAVTPSFSFWGMLGTIDKGMTGIGWKAECRLFRSYVANPVSMELETVTALCSAFDAADLPYWVDGGWGVDALLGEQTRPHSDLDLAGRLGDMPQFERLLVSLGYQLMIDPEQRSWNPVFRHPKDGSVDLHGFVLNANGEGMLGEPSENSMYPAGALDGVGLLGAIPVRCIAAPFVLMFRNGFEPRAVDHHDVDVLCSRFDIKRPSRFS